MVSLQLITCKRLCPGARKASGLIKAGWHVLKEGPVATRPVPSSWRPCLEKGGLQALTGLQNAALHCSGLVHCVWGMAMCAREHACTRTRPCV